jgi:hypothetical protein
MRQCRLWLAAGLLAAVGCREPPNLNRYVPAEPEARQALTAALEAWRAGRESSIRAGTAGVVFVDSQRKPGQRLRRFMVLGEAPGDAPRCFSVRLFLEEPAEEVRVRYVVYGIDPLWVERHEDFLMMLRWECATRESGAKPPPTTAPAHKPDKPGSTAPAKP